MLKAYALPDCNVKARADNTENRDSTRHNTKWRKNLCWIIGMELYILL